MAGRDVAVLTGTLLLWFAVMAMAARSTGFSPWPTATWSRWDTGLYVSMPTSPRCSRRSCWGWHALDRQRWLLAGLCGAVAAVMYPLGVLIGSIAIVPLTAVAIGVLRLFFTATLI